MGVPGQRCQARHCNASDKSYLIFHNDPLLVKVRCLPCANELIAQQEIRVYTDEYAKIKGLVAIDYESPTELRAKYVSYDKLFAFMNRNLHRRGARRVEEDAPEPRRRRLTTKQRRVGG